MSDMYKSQSFGYYLVRVGSIVLGVLLLGLIIWGIFQLDGSSFLSGLVRLILSVFVLLVIGTAILFAIRLISGLENINFRRILSIGLAVIVFGFIVWGIFRLADTNDVPEVAETTISEEVAPPEAEEESAPATNNQENTRDNQSQSSANSTPSSEQTRQPASNNNTNQPATRANGEDLPNTGLEPEVLSAISAGVLAFALTTYVASKKALFVVDQR